VTPFAPAALVAMLLAFYPDVSAAAFAQARRERPEYFAGGTIVGSHGDKLQLPDGHVWDCIFDVDNATGQRHWQAIDVSDDGNIGDPVFVLEPGPLTPIDPQAWPEPTPAPIFAPIVAAALRELGGSDTVLSTAHSTLTEAADPAALEAVFANTVPGADAELSGQLNALHYATPDDVLATTQSHDGAIDKNEAVFDEQPPPDLAPGPELPPAPPIDIPDLPDR
jgi:hypothetical protein